jgi:hypothetical protein
MRRPSGAHLIASIALFAALGGGAYAASSVGSADIERDAVRSKHVRDGDIRAADLSRAVRLKLNRRGAAGVPGPKGDRGARGARGRRGRIGPAGPAGGFSAALPAGQTVRGVYVLGAPAGAGPAEAAIDFPFALASAPAARWIARGAAGGAECPGSAAAPAAAAGHLCIYEDASAGAALRTVFHPGTGADGAAAFGAGLRLAPEGAEAVRSSGSWAVTAP